MNSKINVRLVVLCMLFNSIEMLARAENKCKQNHDVHGMSRGKKANAGNNKANLHLIDQCHIDKAGGTLILTESGEYRLKENISGTINITAKCLCLDLACHTLSANGKPNAIVIKKSESVKVSNGSISDSTQAGIVVDSSTSVSLNGLFMHDHAINALSFKDSADLSVSDIDFQGTTQGSVSQASTKASAQQQPTIFFGERALLFDTCNTIAVNRCNASGFLSTSGAVLELNSCNIVSVQDVNVSNCTKTTIAEAYYFTAATALVFVGGPGVIGIDETITGCTGVDFNRVKVSNNTINNNIAATDPLSGPLGNWRTFEAIEFLFSSGCSLTNCETSNNQDVAGALATEDTEDYMLLTLFCDNCVVTGHESNNNSCTAPVFYFLGIMAANSTNMVFDGCAVNNNTVQELVAVDFSFTSLSGFWIAPYFDGPSSDNCIIRNCRINFNTVTDGGTRPFSKGELGALYPIWILGSNNTTIDHCQICNNVMESTGLSQSVVGILLDGAADTTITHSTINSNTGGEVSAGIDLFQAVRPVVRNCSANNNGGWGIGSDYYFFPGGPVTDAAIIDCECNGNGGNAWSAGIFINGSTALVKRCQVNHTSSAVIPDTLSGDMAGIIVQNATNVLIENSSVVNSSSTNTTTPFKAHGILIDSLTDSQIRGTKVNGNQNSGVELITTSFVPFVFTNPAILEPIRAFYTINGPRITTPIPAPGEVTDPTNACTSVANLIGKIGIVLQDGACGSGKFVLDTEAAHAVATLIINGTGDPANYAGSPLQTKVAVAISQEDGQALLTALADNPGTTLILNTLPFSNNDAVSIIECSAKDNGDNGFEFAAGSTVSDCLVQDCRALGNKKAGFVHATTPLTTTFIGNAAQSNGATADDNYVIADPANNKISLQEYAWKDGSMVSINPVDAGAVAVGARFTNLRTVREHAIPKAQD